MNLCIVRKSAVEFAPPLVIVRRSALEFAPPQIITRDLDKLIHEPVAEEKLQRFQMSMALDSPDRKTFKEIRDGQRLIDVIDVSIQGYLSTFEETTRSDRQGDYVIRGAFDETIPVFMKNNPILLRDHYNVTEYIAGRFTEMREDSVGLFVRAKLTDAPSNLDVRFKVADGTLKTLSMGGLFHYKEDGRGIFKVDLWEGSLVPIPANPDAQITVRSLDDVDREFIQSGMKSFYQFVQARQSRNHAGLAA